MKFTLAQIAFILGILSLSSLSYLVLKIRKLTAPPPLPKSKDRPLWVIFILKYASGVSKIGLMAFLGATVSASWDNMSHFEQLCIVLTAVAQMLTYTEGFLDQTAAKLAAGKPPIGTNGTGNTVTITKADILPETKP